MADLRYFIRPHPRTSSEPGANQNWLRISGSGQGRLYIISPQIPDLSRARPVSRRMTNTTPGAVRMIKLREFFSPR